MDLSGLSDVELRRLAGRLEAARSPASFGRWLVDGFQVCSHTRLIGEELARLRAGGGVRRLMVLAPPRSGKSFLVTQLFPLWWLMHDPGASVVAASHGASLAARWGRSVRGLVREHGRSLGLELSSEQRGAQEWRLVSGGGMKTVGVGQGLTGHDADLLLCDDPIRDRADAESRLVRDSLDDWWSSTFTSRMSPGTPVCLIMTPWHPDDLAARLVRREPDKWRVVRLPAFADRVDDPLGRAVGEPLPHPKIPESDRVASAAFWEERREESLPRDWHALYMCDPRPEGGALITGAELEGLRVPVGGVLPGALRVAVAVDPSGSARGDDTGIVSGFLGEDERVYVTGDRTERLAPTDWARVAMSLAFDVGADVVFVEANFGGEMTRGQLLSAWGDLEEKGVVPEGVLAPAVKLLSSVRYGKRIRAEAAAQRMRQGGVRFVGRFPGLEDKWSSWPPGSRESPGVVDAVTFLVQGLAGGRGGVEVPGVVEPPQGFSIDGDVGDWVSWGELLGGRSPRVLQRLRRQRSRCCRPRGVRVRRLVLCPVVTDSTRSRAMSVLVYRRTVWRLMFFRAAMVL